MRCQPFRFIWGVYAWLLIVPVLLVVALLTLALSTLPQRRQAAQLAARAYFRLCGLPVRAVGMERLPAGPCIVVANHASYVDGPLLCATLPPRFGFVIKKEVSRIPLVGFVLRRLGHEFVERFNRHEGASDARRILRAVVQGDSVVFFPEGTFSAQAGLARFHTGAFVTAARAGVPVAPVVIRGTRRVLGAHRYVPYRSSLAVEALEPITVMDGTDIAAAMRDTARARIGAALDEPVL
jgi:1-acyl-sn-glycerol-3-phosphate acyltransferase